MYSDLFVNRCGFKSDSCMKTLNVIEEIHPDTVYNIYQCNIKKNTDIVTIKNQHVITPLHTKILNKWNTDTIYDTNNNNILGMSGEFQVGDNIKIPIADTISEYLSFYNCSLVKNNDNIKFDTPKTIPLFEMCIGKKYVANYLLTKNGGGCYLEYHDTPHFHMPINENCDGYLILGKIIDNYCYLSAFKIPYLCGIYTPPFTIHCDAFLVGNYLVAYAKTDNFSTVILKNNDDFANIIIY